MYCIQSCEDDIQNQIMKFNILLYVLPINRNAFPFSPSLLILCVIKINLSQGACGVNVLASCPIACFSSSKHCTAQAALSFSSSALSLFSLDCARRGSRLAMVRGKEDLRRSFQSCFSSPAMDLTMSSFFRLTR